MVLEVLAEVHPAAVAQEDLGKQGGDYNQTAHRSKSVLGLVREGLSTYLFL